LSKQTGDYATFKFQPLSRHHPMSFMEAKMNSEDTTRKIRDLLLNDWDPLVVKGYGPSQERAGLTNLNSEISGVSA